MKKRIIITASAFGALAVIAGAFGAHALKPVLSAPNMEIWHTAVQYQFYHVFALLALSTLHRLRTRFIKDCYYLFTFGMILFSGSLYLLACGDLRGWGWVSTLGPATPVGGLLLIGGWVTLGITALKNI